MSRLVAALVVVSVAAAAAAPLEKYATKYDHLDVERLLNNRRMVNHYAACMLNRGPCPPQGVEFKRILPEALHTNCLRCTEKQKTVVYQSIKRLKKEYPQVWAEMAAEYDPSDIYVRKFESTFEQSNSVEPGIPLLSDRFGGDDEGAGSNGGSVTQKTPGQSRPSTTARPSTSTSTVGTTTTKAPSTFSTTTKTTTSRTTTTTHKPTTTSTNRPATNPSIFVRPRPLAAVGANIQATVSFASNVVGDVVRGLGNLGTRVVETGARIADAVIKSVVRT